MPLPVAPRWVRETWLRHVPHRADPLGTAQVPSDGRWQRGKIVRGLYLARDEETVIAEWYRSLAERGQRPDDALPFDLHAWRIDLRLADLTTRERLARVGLDLPTPDWRTWSAYQRIGEQLHQQGWPGLICPSAARPDAQITCLFVPIWPPRDGAVPIDPPLVRTVQRAPMPPRGMTT